MSARVSKADLQARFNAVSAAARHVGIEEAERWTLYKGQPTYGIVTVDPETGGHSSVVAYIGTSAREAYDYLGAMREAYALLTDSRRAVA